MPPEMPLCRTTAPTFHNDHRWRCACKVLATTGGPLKIPTLPIWFRAFRSDRKLGNRGAPRSITRPVSATTANGVVDRVAAHFFLRTSSDQRHGPFWLKIVAAHERTPGADDSVPFDGN